MPQLETVLNFIRARKAYFIIGSLIFLFLFARIILLQKPSTDIVYTAEKSDLVDTVKASGTYATASQTQIISPTNGIISEIFITDGQEIKKGENLFHVESTATPSQQKSANAAYLAANAAVQTDKATLYTLQSNMYGAWDTYQQLATNSKYQNSDGSPNTPNRNLPEFTTAQNDWLAAEALLKNQQNIIAKDQASLSSTKQNYDETRSVTVVAPTSGTVVNLLAQVGDQVKAAQTSPSASSEPVLVIANLSNPYISANISEDYATRIVQGQSVQITFDSLKDKSFKGTVAHIASVGINSGGIVTYPIRINAYGLPNLIKPNMTALITIETQRKDNIITIPASAIITTNGKSFVKLAGSHKLIPVQLGIKGVSVTEIVSGLTPGQKIVANP